MEITSHLTDASFAVVAERRYGVQIEMAQSLDTPEFFVLRTRLMDRDQAAHIADFLRGVADPGEDIRTVIIRDIPVGENMGRVTLRATPKEHNLYRYRLSPHAGMTIRDILVSSHLAFSADEPSSILIPSPPEMDQQGQAIRAWIPALLADRQATVDYNADGMVISLPAEPRASDGPDLPTAYHAFYDLVCRDRAVPMAGDRALFNREVIRAGGESLGVTRTHSISANDVLFGLANAAGDVGVPEKDRVQVAHALLIDAALKRIQDSYPDVWMFDGGVMKEIERLSKITSLLEMGANVTKAAVVEAVTEHARVRTQDLRPDGTSPTNDAAARSPQP